MRTLRVVGLLAVLGVLLLTACETGEVEVTRVVKETVVEKETVIETVVEKETIVEKETVVVEAEAGMPKAGGSLIVAVPNIVHLDPNSVNQYGLNEIVQNFYETLVDRNAEGEIEPLLIKDIEISDDGLVHTWTLQPNVKFHDGTDFNAEVVKWNLDRKINDTMPMWDLIPFESIEVIDDQTVQVTLSRPFTSMYNILHVKTFSMYSPTFVEEVGVDGLASAAVGTGPFMVDEYVPNEFLRLTKNPDYWQEGLPYLDEITFRVVPDNNTRATMLEAGDADVAGFLSIQDIDRFKLVDDVDIHAGVSSRHYYLALNNSNPPLDDVQVRKAINHAIDKVGMARTVFLGYAEPAKAVIVNPAVNGYTEAGFYEYDPEKAMQLLDDAGWTDTNGDGTRDKDGEELVFKLRTRKGTTPGDIETAELVQGLLADIGIKVDIDIVDTASFLAELNQPLDNPGYPEYDILNLSWGTFTGDAEYVLKTYYSCDAWPPTYWDYSHYCNEDVDAMIAEADTVPTLEERNAIYADVIRTVFDEAPTIVLFDGLSTVASRSNVKGLYLDPAQTVWPVKYVWLEQ
jgi:glutathione transport system substrate-binding protein